MSPRKVLQARSETRSDCCPCLRDSAEELGMVLQPVLEPVLLALEPDQDARRPSVASDQDLPPRGKLEVSREVILHLCQRDPARLGWPFPRAKRRLSPSG